ncbi:hypothetical protein Y032_0008g25 [Ancylostoma ceylanicum]|uniref:Secreted protein n=1 Tax=Ancylostoma ceylanicum TaxID=53326 RepID=A0A016VLL2_9BILA|nr:hypothetical protein Y032_0008g25 [Ancylostoma ceylanicum]
MRLPPQQYVVLRCFTVLFALLHQKDALNTASCSPYQARGTASSSLPVDGFVASVGRVTSKLEDFDFTTIPSSAEAREITGSEGSFVVVHFVVWS